MTKEELRRFHSYLGMQLMKPSLNTDERKEIVGLRGIIQREFSLKDLEKNPHMPYVRQSDTGE